MSWSALPEHLNSPEKWKGTDNDKWWMRWEIQTKGWWAFGPRAKEWWARWREIPIVLFAIKGKGPWRWEDADSDRELLDYSSGCMANGDLTKARWILSRVQYYCQWHFAIQWPLQVTFHIKDRNGVPWFVYGPIHRDADKVYWLLSFFLGHTWK